MTRRRTSATTHGLTVPLMTRADGGKFGKTADGAEWLDAARTLTYEIHQYFVNVDDRDVERFGDAGVDPARSVFAGVGLEKDLGAFSFLRRQPFLGQQCLELGPFIVREADKIAFSHG